MTFLRARAALAVLLSATLAAPHGAWAASMQSRPASRGVDVQAPALRTTQASAFTGTGANAVTAHPILKVVDALPASVLTPDLATSKGVRALEQAVSAMPEGESRQALTEMTRLANASLSGGEAGGAEIAAAYDKSQAAPAEPAGFMARLATKSWMPKALASRLAPAKPAPQAIDPKELEVPIEKLRWTPAKDLLPKNGTREVMLSDQMIVGQDRALRAIRFGLKMPGSQHHLFVSGPNGSGRETAVLHEAERLAAAMPNPGDRVAATNFEDPKNPVILSLPPGAGTRFQAAVKKFLAGMQVAMPQLLSSPEAMAQRKQVQQELDGAQRARRAAIEAEIAQVRIDGKFGVKVIPQKTEDGFNFNVAVTYESNGAFVTVSSVEEVADLVSKNVFTRAEWEAAVAKAEEAAAPFIEKYEAHFAQSSQEAEAATQQFNQINAQLAMQAASQMAAPVMRAVMPNRHDTPEHKIFDAKVEARQKEFMQEMLKVRIGVYGIILQMGNNGSFNVALTKAQGDKMVPMKQEEMESAMSSGQVTQAAIQQAVMPLIQKLKAMQALNQKEHEEVHKNDPAPTADELAAQKYVQRLAQHAAMNYPVFLPEEMLPDMGKDGERIRFSPSELFRVSVVVDASKRTNAPVIMDENPSLETSFGKAEDSEKTVMLPGRAMPVKIQSPGGPTIVGGLFEEAHGGFYVVDVMKALRAPGYWDTFMKAVANGEVEVIEDGLAGLLMGKLGTKYKVESRPKVVLLGSPSLKYLLAQHDDGFRTYFNAGAQFEHWLPIGADSVNGYLQFMKRVITTSSDLMDFTADGVAAILEEAARFADSNVKFTSQFGLVYDLMRRATFWAREQGAKEVRGEHVAEALKAEKEAGDAMERYMLDHFAKGSSKISVHGMEAEQVNGLVVTGMGFGLPQRVVAQYFPSPMPFRVVWADQAAQWTGPMANKSLSDVEARILGLFGKERPLTGTVKISFTQMSGGVDGDSATGTMIYAALSAMSGVKLNQGFAVTGSANPHGTIQPIGGAIEKTEGFFDVAQRLLTKAFKNLVPPVTGVLIPDTNVENLQLKPEIVQAARDGRFKVYQIRSDKDAMELLTAEKVGERGIPFETFLEMTFKRIRGLGQAKPKGQ